MINERSKVPHQDQKVPQLFTTSCPDKDGSKWTHANSNHLSKCMPSMIEQLHVTEIAMPHNMSIAITKLQESTR